MRRAPTGQHPDVTRRFALLTTVLGATLACAGAADASVVRPARDASLRVTGLGPEPYGTAVSGVGDVNGDGRPDVAVLQEQLLGAPTVLVVLGRPGRSAIDAAQDPGAAGFTITDPPDQVPSGERGGLTEATFVGASVGPAGDVNGDGIGDVLVGHAQVGNSLRRGSGSAFVVFGRRDPAPVRLDRLGAGGFRVDGPRAFSALGFQHAPLGDVDGDGLGDEVLGANGAAFVVFGSRSPETVPLALGQPRFEPVPVEQRADRLDVGALAQRDDRRQRVAARDDLLNRPVPRDVVVAQQRKRLGRVEPPGPDPLDGGVAQRVEALHGAARYPRGCDLSR